MRIATGSAHGRRAGDATAEAGAEIAGVLAAEPHLVVAMVAATLDVDAVLDQLRTRWPGAMIHGATSCLGAMTGAGFHGSEGDGLALWALHDPAGAYGTGMADMGADAESARAAAMQAVRDAVVAADRPGELPAMLWLSSAPGREEAVLAGIHDVVGTGVPVAGGSTADNAVTGTWQQFSHLGTAANGVVITAFFPSVEVGMAFHNGYRPTEERARVTAAKGRVIHELDGEPAAQVYNRWTDGLIADVLPEGGTVLARSTFHPLGYTIGEVERVPRYLLLHPAYVHGDGSLSVFADAPVGRELVLMSGSRESLIGRAGRVVEAAMQQRGYGPDDVAGALMVYCGGCLLSVGDGIHDTAADVAAMLDRRPFLCGFTFGEQGCFVDHGNRHGNLMISAAVFGR